MMTISHVKSRFSVSKLLHVLFRKSYSILFYDSVRIYWEANSIENLTFILSISLLDIGTNLTNNGLPNKESHVTL